MDSTPKSTREACAYQQGRRAAGTSKTNPHKKHLVDHAWWQKGYEDAKRLLEDVCA